METKFGFTLIELLIVIFILGILAVLGLSSYKNSLSRGKDSRRKTDLVQLKNSLRLYYNDYQRYPANDSRGKIILKCTGEADRTLNWGDVFNCGATVYMSALPKDPKDPSLSYYYLQSTDDNYDLYSCLENIADPNRIDCPAITWCPSITGSGTEQRSCYKLSAE